MMAMIPILASGFGAWDWAVLGGYLLLLLVSGIWFARREPSGANEYFVANRRMPAWAVAFSIIASSLSVATFLGVPEQALRGDLTYLSTNIGGILAVFVVAWVFIPAFYRNNVTTVYELLERRYGPGAKYAASAAFMVGRVFASGARTYMAAMPLAMLIFGVDAAEKPAYLAGAIAILAAVAVLYTLVGGIASVIWTDVLQTIVMVGAVVAAVVLLLHRIPAPWEELVAAWRSGGTGGTSKLSVIQLGLEVGKPGLGFDPAAKFTVLTAVLGFMLLNLAAYGTDHDMAQRMLTCKSSVHGGRSAIAAIFMGIPIVALFAFVGLLLFIFYQRPELMGRAGPQSVPPQGVSTFLWFIFRELPTGLSGVMVAGLFAVGLGSLNSAINAMAATFVKDFYMRFAPGRSDVHYLKASRWAVAGWGIVLAAFAVFCIFWKRSRPDTTLIDFALSVMTFAYGGLVAVFLAALFTRRGNTISVIAALVTGFLVVLAFQSGFWAWIGDQIPSLFVGIRRPLSGLEVEKAWPWLHVAFAWHMLFATAAAFVVCVLGKRSGAASSASL